MVIQGILLSLHPHRVLSFLEGNFLLWMALITFSLIDAAAPISVSIRI
jgi:hypothetical protein